MKHTPGPWSITTYPDEHIWIIGGHGSSVYDSSLADTWPLSNADARLIAAAPELLEALQATESELDRMEGATGLAVTEAVIMQARAAIAKAKADA